MLGVGVELQLPAVIYALDYGGTLHPRRSLAESNGSSKTSGPVDYPESCDYFPEENKTVCIMHACICEPKRPGVILTRIMNYRCC